MLDNSPLATDASFLLADVTRQLRALFAAEMEARGLTGAAWRVLAYLAREDRQTQSELARKLEISRVALGETIDRLERDGWVVRGVDADDRRIWRIRLTEQSREKIPEIRSVAKRLERDCFSVLSEVQIANLNKTLTTLRTHLDALRSASTQTMDDT